FFFFSSRRRHTRFSRDWSSDVCSSDLLFCDSVQFYLEFADAWVFRELVSYPALLSDIFLNRSIHNKVRCLIRVLVFALSLNELLQLPYQRFFLHHQPSLNHIAPNE